LSEGWSTESLPMPIRPTYAIRPRIARCRWGCPRYKRLVLNLMTVHHPVLYIISQPLLLCIIPSRKAVQEQHKSRVSLQDFTSLHASEQNIFPPNAMKPTIHVRESVTLNPKADAWENSYPVGLVRSKAIDLLSLFC